MADQATIQERIDKIDAQLASGVRSGANGVRRVDYDLDALRAERSRLLNLIASSQSSSFRRVVMKSG